MPISILLNDTAATGATLNPATVQITGQPLHGSVVVASGVATYTPALNYFGPDGFAYKVSDSHGVISNEAAVSVTVTPINDAPLANAGPDQSVTGGATVLLDGTASNDLDGAIATYLWTQTGGTGVSLINPDASRATFTAPTPSPGTTVALTFSLTVTDGAGAQGTDTVVIQVLGPGFFAPTASADSATTPEDTAVEIDLLANDASSAGGFKPETVTVVSAPFHGTVAINAATGVATYTPALNTFGTDSFTYQVRDKNNVLSNTAAVTLTVTPVNDAPVASAGPDQQVKEGTLVTLDGSASRDVEDTVLTFAWTQTGGTMVTLSDPAAARPTFTAPAVAAGDTLLTFKLTVADSGGLSAESWVTVRVVDAAVPCDANASGAIDMADAIVLLKTISGIPVSGLSVAADVNGDGKLGLPEVFCVLQSLAGMRFVMNQDLDGDGFTPAQGDCNDNDPNIHPGATEICDGIDNNCNGQIDEGLSQFTFYRDADGDGYGDPNSPLQACGRPAGYVANSLDCDDTNANFRPGQTWYRDADNDGYSDGTTLVSCTQPAGYKLASALAATSGDCDDANPNLHPGQIWNKDGDNDGYSDGTTLVSCTQPAGYKLASELTATSGDCNDNDPNIHPGATEICDGIDNNCNGQIDEGLTQTAWYRDADGDGYGNPNDSTQACAQPAGYVANNTDCDDTRASVHPGATESCNGIDDNCNGQIDEG